MCHRHEGMDRRRLIIIGAEQRLIGLVYRRNRWGLRSPEIPRYSDWLGVSNAIETKLGQ